MQWTSSIFCKKTSITLHQSIDTLWYVNTEHEDREIWTRRALAGDKNSATPAMIRWLGDSGSETESVPKINGVFPVSAGAICLRLNSAHRHTHTHKHKPIRKHNHLTLSEVMLGLMYHVSMYLCMCYILSDMYRCVGDIYTNIYPWIHPRLTRLATSNTFTEFLSCCRQIDVHILASRSTCFFEEEASPMLKYADEKHNVTY